MARHRPGKRERMRDLFKIPPPIPPAPIVSERRDRSDPRCVWPPVVFPRGLNPRMAGEPGNRQRVHVPIEQVGDVAAAQIMRGCRDDARGAHARRKRLRDAVHREPL